MQEAVGLNTTSTIYNIDSESLMKISGSPTSKAILTWDVFDLNMNMNEIYNPCWILKFREKEKWSIGEDEE